MRCAQCGAKKCVVPVLIIDVQHLPLFHTYVPQAIHSVEHCERCGTDQ